jgi:hypothetical protein
MKFIVKLASDDFYEFVESKLQTLPVDADINEKTLGCRNGLEAFLGRKLPKNMCIFVNLKPQKKKGEFKISAFASGSHINFEIENRNQSVSEGPLFKFLSDSIEWNYYTNIYCRIESF